MSAQERRRTVGEACQPYDAATPGSPVRTYAIVDRLSEAQLRRAAGLLAIARPALFETVVRDGDGGAR